MVRAAGFEPQSPAYAAHSATQALNRRGLLNVFKPPSHAATIPVHAGI